MMSLRFTTSRSVIACALAMMLGCSSGDDPGSAENSSGGRRGDGGDRGTVDLGNLFDAAVDRDSGSTHPLQDGGGGAGDAAASADADAVSTDDGGTLEPDAEANDPLTIPADPGERGPWPVGVRTVELAIGTGRAPVEIWYPAVQGSEAGESQVVYDFIDWLPPEAIEDIPDAEKPVHVPCDCYRDLPIDAAHGPFPISIFVHNIGAFRASSVGLMEHWASRGFVVVALDHPRLTLADVLADATVSTCSGSRITSDATHRRDLTALTAAIRGASGDYAFLAGAIDAARIAVSGHGDGAEHAARASGLEGVRVVMQWNNSLPVTKSGDLEAVAYFAGSEDPSPPGAYATVENAAIDAPAPSLFVGTDNAGLLSMTELCNAQNSLGRDGMAIATRYELCGADYNILSIGWDCNPRYLSQETANTIFGYATTAALEQYLKGKDHSASWQSFSELWGEARELR